ncbi:pentapeptide repeat-containing protein [bacterium]|nr:pentapeptide repeat-containing protein [bacterium]
MMREVKDIIINGRPLTEMLEIHAGPLDAENGDGRFVDLHGADLKRADLRGADLHKADLTESDLTGADLTGADLTGANLSGAKLTWTRLSRADLTGANLSGANLSWSNFGGANLTGVVLRGALLNDANLTDVILSGAQHLSKAKGFDTADFTGALLDDQARQLLSAVNKTVELKGEKTSGPIHRHDLHERFARVFERINEIGKDGDHSARIPIERLKETGRQNGQPSDPAEKKRNPSFMQRVKKLFSAR